MSYVVGVWNVELREERNRVDGAVTAVAAALAVISWRQSMSNASLESTVTWPTLCVTPISQTN